MHSAMSGLTAVMRGDQHDSARRQYLAVVTTCSIIGGAGPQQRVTIRRAQEDEVSTMEQRPKKLLDQVRDASRLKHDSLHTEASYVTWIKRYILFHNKRHPNQRARAELEAFLTHLAGHQQVAASTQNQALNVLLCLYRDIRNMGCTPKFNPVFKVAPRCCPVRRLDARAATDLYGCTKGGDCPGGDQRATDHP
jgi:hypothetical protein